MAQFWGVDADVAIDNEEGIRLVGTDYVLIMHIAEVDVGRGKRPVARVLQLEAHALHVVGNLFAKRALQRVVNALRPAANGLGPLFYDCLLLRSALALSLEVAESLRSV